MEKKKKIIVIALAAVAVVVIAAAVIIAVSLSSGGDYMSYVRKGQQYLASGDYNKAVSAFQSAISKDSTKEEGYAGLADAYERLGYTSLVEDTLQRGVNATGSSSLAGRLANFRGDPGGDEPFILGDTSNAIAAADEEIKGDPALNIDTLDFIASASFADYEARYGIDNIDVNGDTYTYTVNALGLELVYYNDTSSNKINSSSNKPFDEYMPSVVRFTKIAYLFGTSGPISYDVLENLFYVENLSRGDGSVDFDVRRCHISISTDADGNITSDSSSTVSINEAQKAGNGDDGHVCIMKGRVTDAATGESISEATVKAYAGHSENGEPIETKTDSSGNYSIETSGGDYYVTVEKDGYIKGNFEVYVLSNAPDTTANFSITEELGDDVIRIILTWGSTPPDLDSYLVKEDGSVVTSYYNKVATDGSGNKIAEQDLDNRNGYGPETTTLYDMEGSYEFLIVDYNVTETMASSGAQVKVYKGSSLVTTVDIASDVVNVWTAVKIVHGEVQVTNSAKDVPLSPGNK